MRKSSKYLATVSLAIMAVGFVATLFIDHSVMGLVLQGGFEAGIVGGLADWFAVTALFRHPMGIPIPHTALLSKNRGRITTALVSVIENNWLAKDSIQEKMKQIDVIPKLMAFLAVQLPSESTKKMVRSLLLYGIDRINSDKLAPFIEKQLKAMLMSVSLQPIIQAMLQQVLDKKYDEKILDSVLEKAEVWLIEEDRSQQIGKLAQQALDEAQLEGFAQFAIKSLRNLLTTERLGKTIIQLLSLGVESLKRHDHPNREALLVYIRTEIASVGTNRHFMEEAQNYKAELITDWELSEPIDDIIEKIRQKSVQLVEDGTIWDHYALPYIQRSLTKLENKPELLERFETVIHRHLGELIEENHSKIGKLVQENVDKLDEKELIQMMESNIGKDLQWIRVNGAICGFLIGIVISVFKLFI